MEFSVKGKVILGVAAHADDLDFGASGSIAKWVKEGAKVYYLILTDGSKGSEDMTITSKQLAAMREEEQKNAAKVLGVNEVFFGGFTDGELVNNQEVRYAIVRKIRELKPDMVVTTDPTFVYSAEFGFINHPDHRNAGQATLDAVFPFARNSRTFPDLLEEGLSSHIARDIFLINFGKGNFFVDITSTMDQKLKALAEHKSQFRDFEQFKKHMQQRAKLLAEKTGMEYAESFVHIHLNS